MGRLSLMVLACFSCTPSCFASPNVRRLPLAHPVGPRDFMNISFPITQAGPLEPSTTVPGLPDESPTSTCTIYSPCNIFYQYVSIFYWPTESQNTACLSSLSSPPPSSIPAGLVMTSPSIYAIFPSIMASDGCNQIGGTYSSITTSFAPGELSTIADYSTGVYNFADLPCPPPGVILPPGTTYAPLISPPPFIYALDPAFASCIPGKSQGLDPPQAATTDSDGLQPPAPGRGGGRRDLGARAHAHVAPWAPTRTAEPARRQQL